MWSDMWKFYDEQESGLYKTLQRLVTAKTIPDALIKYITDRNEVAVEIFNK